MARPHAWRECRPVLTSPSGTDPAEVQRASDIVDRVWATLSDADRAAFHRFCCLNRRGKDQVVVERISALVAAELEG